MYSKADNIVFQTNDAKNYFSKKIQAKSVVIPNPIKSNLPYWNKENFNKEIITACRMTAQKNLKMLLDSFNIFSKKNGEYILSIYGEGEELNSLVSYAKEIGINDKVFFRGYCIDVHNKIKDSAIFVMTSDYEGISNAMLEALAIGIPTICTDCPIGGARQFIKDGVNGFLVPVRDYKMFSEKMDYLVNDKELMLSFYSNAIKIRDELEVKKILSRWEELL